MQRLCSADYATGVEISSQAVASDTLGGAVFAWTSPPQVTAIVSASPADGVVSEGQLDMLPWESLGLEIHVLQSPRRYINNIKQHI